MELKKDKKEKLEIMRTDFLSNVSHELKTPLHLYKDMQRVLRKALN